MPVDERMKSEAATGGGRGAGPAPPRLVDPIAWAALLVRAEVLRAEDTFLSGWIRVLRVDGGVVVQEEAPDGRILLRWRADRAAADRFVDQRLATYDRMWNGCGCRVDYDEP